MPLPQLDVDPVTGELRIPEQTRAAPPNLAATEGRIESAAQQAMGQQPPPLPASGVTLPAVMSDGTVAEVNIQEGQSPHYSLPPVAPPPMTGRGPAPDGLGSWHEGLESSVRPVDGRYPDPGAYYRMADNAQSMGHLSEQDHQRVLNDPYLQAWRERQHQQNLRKDAIDAQTKQGEVGLEYQRASMAAQADAQARDAAWREQEQGRQQLAAKAQAAAMDDYNKANDALGAMKVDPGRAWKNKPAIQSILAVFSAALGGYASAYTGQPNVALEMIEAEINRDIDAQKADMSNKAQLVANKRSAYGILREKLGDDERASHMLRKHHWDEVSAKVDQLRGSASTKAQQNTLDAFQQHAARVGEQSDIENNRLGIEIYMAKHKPRGGPVANPGGYRELKSNDLSGVVWDPSKEGRAMGILTGVKPEQAEEIRNQVGAYASMRSNLDRLADIAGLGLSGQVPGAATLHEFDQRWQLLRAPEKKDIAGAAETPTEAEAIDAMLKGTANRTQMGHVQKALLRYGTHKEIALKSNMRAHGLRGFDVQMHVDPRTGQTKFYGREGGAPQQQPQQQNAAAPGSAANPLVR